MSLPDPVEAPLSPRAERAQALMNALAAGPDSSAVDTLMQHTRERLGTQWSHLSVLTDRQLTGASCGPSWAPVGRGQETPYDETICATVLRSGDAVVIPDAMVDARVSSLAAVRSGGVRAYLGTPVHVDSFLVAVLCVFDEQPREWSADDLHQLEATARELEVLLERLDVDDAG